MRQGRNLASILGAKRRLRMPFIQVNLWSGKTKEQKAELAKAITDATVKVLEAPPEAVHVVFQDIPKEDWAVGGKLSG